MELSEDVIEKIKNSRNTMMKASKILFPKLIEANRGFAFKQSEKLNEKNSQEQQIMLLKSNLNGSGKPLKSQIIKYIYF